MSESFGVTSSDGTGRHPSKSAFGPILILHAVFWILLVSVFPPECQSFDSPSKRECAICHIMWLDDFRTDKETLVEWQPGNVLMKDTQGVVSSDEMCYSCHDGYVLDSRDTVWKHNNHKTFVRPSENVSVPDDLTLSNKDEIYCGTCHSAHGEGAAPTEDSGGLTSFFRVPNVDSGLCEMCHRAEAHRSPLMHPVRSDKMAIPDVLFASGATEATKKNRVICQTCHKTHGAAGTKITVLDNTASGLCLACHEDQKFVMRTKHDLRFSLPAAKNIRNRTALETGPCGACHTPHRAADSKLWARPRKTGNPASRKCLSCHAENSGFKTKRIGAISHPVDVEIPARQKPAVMEDIPLFTRLGEKNPDGRIQCFTCHDVHKWSPGQTADADHYAREGDATNSFLRISNGYSSLCVTCHYDKRRVLKSDHNLEATAPAAKNIQGFGVEASGPCGACHIPHNAGSGKLWAAELAPGKSFASRACVGCHRKSGAANAKTVGTHSHPVDKTPRDTTVDAKQFPLYAGGARSPDGKIVCLTCHDPHDWAPGSPPGHMIYDYKNMEGDLANSFLRMANFPSSRLCTACHRDKARVGNTDHDLYVTSPLAVNSVGQTAAESGLCGPCHVPHNASSQRLWAVPLPETGDRIEKFCTGCHGKGGAAEAKSLGEHNHPVGIKPRDVAFDTKLLPLYRDIEKSPAGKMACLTCHEPHTWNPANPASPKGPPRNAEGDIRDSFLRKADHPSSALCVTCHPGKNTVRKTDHDLNVTAPLSENLMGRTVAESGLCGACHIPHNASSRLLWANPLTPGQAPVTQFCVGCHGKRGVAKSKQIGDNYHPVDVGVNNTVLAALTTETGTRLPLYERVGMRSPRGKMVCLTCHDPHVWDPKNPGGQGPGKNTEGNTTDSFLRRPNHPSSDLCKLCHPEKIFVEKTDHDLSVTAPDSVNLLGQRVGESGPCGACHLVHNSPNTLKLWARTYGPVEDSQGPMDALCYSCHIKGKEAGNKLPPVASHPKGKLINNIMRFGRSDKEYTPIFDVNGKEKNVGNISCPSCHNTHQWSYYTRDRGAGENVKGDLTNKFLRTKSVNTVCRDCHGHEAIIRYQYFHTPDVRDSRGWSNRFPKKPVR